MNTLRKLLLSVLYTNWIWLLIFFSQALYSWLLYVSVNKTKHYTIQHSWFNTCSKRTTTQQFTSTKLSNTSDVSTRLTTQQFTCTEYSNTQIMSQLSKHKWHMATQQFTSAKLYSHTNDTTIHQTEHAQTNNNVLTSEPSLTNKGLSLRQKSDGSTIKSYEAQWYPSHRTHYTGVSFQKSLSPNCIQWNSILKLSPTCSPK